MPTLTDIWAVYDQARTLYARIDSAGKMWVAGALETAGVIVCASSVTSASIVTGNIASGSLTSTTAVPAIADVGDGVAIGVTQNASMPITTDTAGETNTLAIPTFAGQIISLVMDVDGGGDRVVTVAAAINQAANTTITFDAAGEHIVLIGVQVAGALVWRVLVNDGCTLG